MSEIRRSKTCDGCGQLYFEDDSNCTCPPSFEDWKLDFTSNKLSEYACQFYSEKIGLLQKDFSPHYGTKREFAEDAENFILEDIVDGSRFADEFYSFLKERYKEEKEGL